jgi:hypothetical protein
MPQIEGDEQLAVLLSSHECVVAAAGAKTARDRANESSEDEEDQQFIDET